MYCSPNRNKINNSCFNNIELIAIAKAYNTYTKKIYKKEKLINYSNELININSSDLYKDISQKLNKLCINEYCWTDLDFITTIPDKNLRESIMYFTFKPKDTIKKNAWLSTFNINELLQQYQDMYKDEFKFLGAQPSDFSKIVKLNWKKLKQINPHNKPGSHWLAVFIDNEKKTVDYFDSLGNSPTKNISSFLKHFKKYKFNINKIEYQHGGTQCGIYAINYIIERLYGKTMGDIKNSGISDKTMTELRKQLFRPNNSLKK